MLPLKEKDKPIIQKLLAAGCCGRCILRLCCINVRSCYRQPLQVTLEELRAFVEGPENDTVKDSATQATGQENKLQHGTERVEEPPCKRVKLDPDEAAVINSCDIKSDMSEASLGVPDSCTSNQAEKMREETNIEFRALVQDSVTPASGHENKLQQCADGLEEPSCKRDNMDPNEAAVVNSCDVKSDICAACLGILQDSCSSTQAQKIAATVKAKKYEFDSMFLSISLPAQLCVRDHSYWLHVKKEVRNKNMVLDKDDVIQVKEAFKWIIQGLIAKELGSVLIVPKSEFEVGVEFTHPETDTDCHFLAKTCADCFKANKDKQVAFTRMAVVKALDKISDDKFLKHFPCPPPAPTSSCVSQDVQCLHASVFIAGRYNKFCRNLPQTPWLIDGERRMESSVEELIAAPILSAFRAEGFNFSSSGREDVDVRTLGNGRPFAIELVNPHNPRKRKPEMMELQKAVNKSSDKIRVRDLQIVTREAMSRMKEGEEDKTKSYTALVWTQRAIQREDLAFIDDIKDLTLDQKTPLRVLHRRALAVRQRVVHSMSSRFVDTHHFYLGLKTQAGTYIKEFVHGDFGRTKPNMCELLKTDTDILELDVESVDVDWPPAIPE